MSHLVPVQRRLVDLLNGPWCKFVDESVKKSRNVGLKKKEEKKRSKSHIIRRSILVPSNISGGRGHNLGSGSVNLSHNLQFLLTAHHSAALISGGSGLLEFFPDS